MKARAVAASSFHRKTTGEREALRGLPYLFGL